MSFPRAAPRFLGRTFNANTQCWEAPWAPGIPVEKADEVLRPGATMVDLLALLCTLRPRVCGADRTSPCGACSFDDRSPGCPF